MLSWRSSKILILTTSPGANIWSVSKTIVSIGFGSSVSAQVDGASSATPNESRMTFTAGTGRYLPISVGSKNLLPQPAMQRPKKINREDQQNSIATVRIFILGAPILLFVKSLTEFISPQFTKTLLYEEIYRFNTQPA